DLAAQRDWLVGLLARLAARYRVRPTVYFDGAQASGGRPPAGGRAVEVRYTAAGLTADDEIVFAVEAMEPRTPVLVVTDDRELAGRVAALRADVIGTGPLVWAAG